MTRIFVTFCTLALAGCTGQANHLGNPLLWPFRAAATGLDNAAYSDRRGQVEILVKQTHPALIEEIRQGGGPTLTRAQDLARVPPGARALHVVQLQSDRALHAASPDALVVAIMVAGG
ncbi:MAG: hypothetical protein HLUCCA08_14380 [Rhodobacteraceae bacterium HLUCCA08]|nr:MAG: hypothetical protein HLUCCA08_14380 [Rhodobacteraceae bacterium HLUCCA08]